MAVAHVFRAVLVLVPGPSVDWNVCELATIANL